MGGKQAKISSTNGSLNNCSSTGTHENQNQLTKQIKSVEKRKISSSSSSWRLSSNSHSTLNLNSGVIPLMDAPASNMAVNYQLVPSPPQQPKLQFNTINEPQFNNNNQKLKRFGISPKFKRKIVEVISRTARNDNKQTLFSSNKLYNVFQSQLNLLQGFHISKSTQNFLQSRQQTLLSTSIERNSFRYQSRRKYHTQSLSNPYRHANTNYPLYIHEALFLPEFSVKGKVTEADFEIIDVVSRGAFGHVIKVKHKNEEDRLYAMKIMWKSQVIRDRALQQVKDEVTIAVACSDNPFIVKTWHYWQSKRFLYIITSFIEYGELLSLWLKVHHFPERIVCIYIAEMSLVLDYLHNKGIIYRDIKMENILLNNHGHVQLIDFGLSKWLKLGEKTSTICGTIQYMGPEVLSVEPYTHAVDYWSLGILMYALLTGEYPLNAAKDHIQMCDRVHKHQFELDPTKYSQSACDLVRKLLCKNPQKRLKSLNEIKQEKFFSNEIRTFYKTVDNGDLGVDFWNSQTVFDYYSPFQVLFDELNSLRVLKFEDDYDNEMCTNDGSLEDCAAVGLCATADDLTSSDSILNRKKQPESEYHVCQNGIVNANFEDF